MDRNNALCMASFVLNPCLPFSHHQMHGESGDEGCVRSLRQDAGADRWVRAEGVRGVDGRGGRGVLVQPQPAAHHPQRRHQTHRRQLRQPGKARFTFNQSESELSSLNTNALNWLLEHTDGLGYGYGLRIGFQTQWLHCIIQNMFTFHRLGLRPHFLFLHRTGILFQVRTSIWV